MDLRYINSVSVLHSLMVAHLEELKLSDVSKSLKEQIPIIMKSEKETRTSDPLIEIAVADFFEGCMNVKPGSSGFVKMFHDFMEIMIRAYHVGDDLHAKFLSKVEKVEVKQLKGCYSIQNLSMFVQGVAYVDPEGGSKEEE